MKIDIIIKRPAFWAAIAAMALTVGCATGPNANPADPLEPFNRTVYNFNDGLDRAILKPVATGYAKVTPQPVRNGVTNFFANLSDVWSLVNNVLQAKPREASDMLFRVTSNTLWGIGGLFDVASEMGIERHREDFGLTLGHYGMPSGAYLVLPLLGPSTVRDAVGTVVDSQGDIVAGAKNVPTRNTGMVLRVVNGRANLLQAGDLLEQAALDKYSFSRDLYLQRRASLIGGKPENEERFDLPETPAGAAKPAATPVPIK